MLNTVVRLGRHMSGSESGEMVRLRSQRHARQWKLATVCGMNHPSVPSIPSNQAEETSFITAENTMKVRR